MHSLAFRCVKGILTVLVFASLGVAACAPEENSGVERTGVPAESVGVDDEPSAVPVQPTSPTAAPAPDEGQESEPEQPAATAPGPVEPKPNEPNTSPEPDGEGPSEGAPTSETRLEEGPPRVVFPYGVYLFIEIVEERVMKSDSGGQTTSFAGDQQTYDFEPEDGALAGPVKGTLSESALTIVGRLVVTQIDRSKATVGQLYVLTQAGQAFGPVTIEAPSADGVVVVVVDGESYALGPGDSISVAGASRGDDDRLALSSASRSVSVTNHGFLQRADLSLTQP